jgi:hypothetical protein
MGRGNSRQGGGGHHVGLRAVDLEEQAELVKVDLAVAVLSQGRGWAPDRGRAGGGVLCCRVVLSDCTQPEVEQVGCDTAGGESPTGDTIKDSG